MVVEREIELLRAEQTKQGERIARLEAWRDNQIAARASAPSWIFGTIAGAVGLLTLILNLYLASR